MLTRTEGQPGSSVAAPRRWPATKVSLAAAVVLAVLLPLVLVLWTLDRRSPTQVLWSSDFSSGSDWRDDLGVVASGKVEAEVEAEGPGGRSDVLAMTFGRDGSRWGMDVRSSFSALGLERREEAWFSYDVYFPEDFEFVGDGKMGGLAGAVPGLDPFAVSSGGDYDDRSFSVRAVWHQDRGLAMYLYAASGAGKDIDDETNYGFAIVERFVDRSGREEGVLEPGRWHRVEHRVRLNTPGEADGVYELWLDGHRGVAVDDVQYRTADRGDIRIDQIFGAWFFGGPREDYPSRINQAFTDDWVLSESLLDVRPWRVEHVGSPAPHSVAARTGGRRHGSAGGSADRCRRDRPTPARPGRDPSAGTCQAAMR